MKRIAPSWPREDVPFRNPPKHSPMFQLDQPNSSIFQGALLSVVRRAIIRCAPMSDDRAQLIQHSSPRCWQSCSLWWHSNGSSLRAVRLEGRPRRDGGPVMGRRGAAARCAAVKGGTDPMLRSATLSTAAGLLMWHAGQPKPQFRPGSWAAQLPLGEPRHLSLRIVGFYHGDLNCQFTHT